MAARQRPTTPPVTSETILDPGTFVSTVPVGYVAASPAEIRRITALMQSPAQNEMDAEFISNLLVIKLLAPEASRDLLIYPAPMVQDFVRRLKTALSMAYYAR